MSLKDRIKNYAYEMGADLVGFGNVERCSEAPLMMSPQGIYPAARTVIVMALHHPDACVEMGGEEHPQKMGPYTVQYVMNARLDEMSYSLATFLEKLGHGAVPIVSSNIWRYNSYKELKAVFAPDVSHIYMAVVAGLADMGFNGLALSPEYGARNRFITVITDAVIEPDPLIPPGTVCDGCMLCRKHCPAAALSKEIDGEKVLKIEGYEYRFPNKNLWRCSWGEHFDLDLDLPIPEKVTEQVLLETIEKHGFRGGEMGQCLKFCVPKGVRQFDKEYSRTPMRRHWISSDESIISRAVADRILARAVGGGAEMVLVRGYDDLKAAGIDIGRMLPGARSVVILAVRPPAEADNVHFRIGARHHLDCLCFDMVRQLEDAGFRSMAVWSNTEGTKEMERFMLQDCGLPGPEDMVLVTAVSRMNIPSQERLPGAARRELERGNGAADIAAGLQDLARELGADLVGVAPAARLEELAGQLRPLFDGQQVLDGADISQRFGQWVPQISIRERRVLSLEDHLPGARSALVFGLRYHQEVLRRATLPPAEAVGPYSFETYITYWMGIGIGYRLVKRLEEMGYRAVLTADLHGTESMTANPRGPQADLFSNRFAGLAAGLGYLAESGHLSTPQFGLRQRLLAVVTDAPLTASAMPDFGIRACESCDERCIGVCPSLAFGERTELKCEGRSFSFRHRDALRCDWVKRYAIMGDGGFKYLGSPLDIPAPETIDAAVLADALRQHDPIKKHRPSVAEPCVIKCPLAVEAKK